jgi:CMP-N-acetylneuraminic acid synthetase
MQKRAILGIIPARGGSKRVPGKNIALLNGKPLLAYTCEAAAGSKSLTRVVLSTDDPAIEAVGRACGVEVPFLRPPELGRDETTTMAVMRHVVSQLREREGYRPELVVILQPTSPLRTSGDIDAGIKLLEQTGADSVVSVVEVQDADVAGTMWMIENGKLRSYASSSLWKTGPLYRRNGAVYVLRTELVEHLDDPYGDDCRALVMDGERSVDIDTQDDLARAERMLRKAG